MPLQVHLAASDDVERIANIHLAAFDSNPLLHVQFPSPGSLTALKSILCGGMRRAVQQGDISGKVILIVKDSDAENIIISFAKWDLPCLGKDVEVHPEVSWPYDCRTEYLDGYHKLAEAMKMRVIGDKACYLNAWIEAEIEEGMTFVGTDPAHQGRGAAKMLTIWGLEKAAKTGDPVYLESTINAVSFYEKLGFVSKDKLSLELPGFRSDGSSNVYEEEGMLRIC